MTVFLRAREVSLELPMDLQKALGERGGRLSAALAGSERIYSRILDGVDFSAGSGDRIGVIGLNGAGKTTLLRVLNGAYHPTSGSVEKRGVMQSLLSTTLGFNENATVAENVYLRGTAMGLRYRQLQAAMDDILGFAGLSRRADQYLHVLSSGQRMRLGFAISTAVQPDILLMDEWIGAGDAAFVQRARDRMLGRFHNSSIVVLASHSTALLREMCNRALVLDKGKMRFFGEMEDGLEVYRGLVRKESDELARQVINSDPLLFGDATGLVERISWSAQGVSIEGWAVSRKGGREVTALCVEIDGHEQVFEHFQRIDREDVRLHLGHAKGAFGFRVEVDVKAVAYDVSALRVSVDAGKDGARTRLPVAARAQIEIAGERA